MRTLTLRLLRATRTVEQAFGEAFAPGGERQLEERPWAGIESARVFVGQIYSNPPPWRTFIASGFGDVPEGIFTAGAGAVIFVPVEERTVAVCFGYIHIALNDDSFERQFGLKVTLNTVPRNQLRSLDLATPDAVTFQKRVQASRDSDLQEFGVDMLRDLARVAGGTPKDRSLAAFVAGKDSLSMTCEVEADTLRNKCSAACAAFHKKSYQREFSWVDNMRVVAEKDTIEQLDANLFAALVDLRAGKNTELHLAPPEIVDYTEGSELRYNGFGRPRTTFHSLSIADYVGELNQRNFAGDVAELKYRHRIRAKVKNDDEFSERWRVYDCFVFETVLGNGAAASYYVLFAGLWYRVDRRFKDSVETFFANIPRVTIVGATTCRNEQQLIADIVATRTDLLKLDKEAIIPGGARYANLEACDFFSNAKQFIHLKDGNSSGSISHLWAQGVVSAEAFVSDKEFRKKLRTKVKSLGRGFEVYLPQSNTKLARDNYTVVYGIMHKPYTDGSLDLPFFSKVSLQAAATRIRQFGISIAVELIEKLG